LRDIKLNQPKVGLAEFLFCHMDGTQSWIFARFALMRQYNTGLNCHGAMCGIRLVNRVPGILTVFSVQYFQ